jgi:long-chain acyl-CoA synthetase
MYPGPHAEHLADHPCIVMADDGATISYGQFEAATNRLAHWLRAHGLQHGNHYAILMENNAQFLEACGAGERAGLYYTPINSHLGADEVAYILQNSDAEVLITSRALEGVASAALELVPSIRVGLTVNQERPHEILRDYSSELGAYPTTPIADERLGIAMLYSSGTTGRPKGIARPLPPDAPGSSKGLASVLMEDWRFRPGMVYLSPAPLYHSAPLAGCSMVIRTGGTIVVMDRFDPESLLRLIAEHRVTHVQMVPTMFNRLLKLPSHIRERYDLSSLEQVVHGAAPCPVAVKEEMIEWWGPIIHEYYSSTEGLGYTSCTSAEWLEHKGSVGRSRFGELAILDDELHQVPTGTPGLIYFKHRRPFNYWKESSEDSNVSTTDAELTDVGDVGYLDDDGYLYLTDRKTFMIVSGGVNIYPQEAENVLSSHPDVADVAVFGVPNPDFGEEVKAVVQLMPGIKPSSATADDLIAYCRARLSSFKCPRTVDFEAQLPRLATGKLYKRELRDRYWTDRDNKLV